jgi:hypothetical protein
VEDGLCAVILLCNNDPHNWLLAIKKQEYDMKIGAMQGILNTDDDALAIEHAAYWGFDAIELIT